MPYLQRRGYSSRDLSMASARAVSRTEANNSHLRCALALQLSACDAHLPVLARKDTHRLTSQDKKAALAYARQHQLPLVALTNGQEILCFNAFNQLPVSWNGEITDKLPTRAQLPAVISALQNYPHLSDISLPNDKSLPFRPALPLKQLNNLFRRCHVTIRNFEKDEENAFADFSKLLFLRLLEEKAEREEGLDLPYSYRFYQLARKTAAESEEVRAAIQTMIEQLTAQTSYGDVLSDPLRLRHARTFLSIVQQLEAVSFYDCELDSKGAAFEYFVRTTLKGRSLGQYFTPRPLIQVMVSLLGRQKLLSCLRAGHKPRIFDPACGTGGFLIYLMQECLRQLEALYARHEIDSATHEQLARYIRGQMFFGSDANRGVACAARMNMIIAGDGHANITAADSLSPTAQDWNIDIPNCDFILTNPPFGTFELQAMTPKGLQQFPIPAPKKGQYLFLQKMVLTTRPYGEICTVIDEGVLNNEKGCALRRWLLQHCRLKAIVALPEETFKPNKINVRSSLLYLQRSASPDLPLERDYIVTFCRLKSLGYSGSGEPIRDFDFARQLAEFENRLLIEADGEQRTGYGWEAYGVSARTLYADPMLRLDYRYWQPAVRQGIKDLLQRGGQALKELNTISTARGQSPAQEVYVDEKDGYALVVKAGNISRFGSLQLDNADYVEKVIYEQMSESHVFYGDILLASTGEGTLGKCCVYRLPGPAIADGHVTIIRVNTAQIYPEYLCDYLRLGFGARQIERLYTGSTGLIELTAEQTNRIIVDLLSNNLARQQEVSQRLRQAEAHYLQTIELAELMLESQRQQFSSAQVFSQTDA
ncbi:N-6 DNA methylase [Ktedonosporobacter rubrisoli]|nr:N-6 DNA methylase [Ktedonosporobacter rubrisoli]